MLKKKQKGVIDPIFIAVLISVLAIGAVIYWRMSQKKPEQASEVANTVSESQETTEKIYENKKIGFTLKYPKDWRFDEGVDMADDEAVGFANDQFVAQAEYDNGNNDHPLLMTDFGTTVSSPKELADFESKKENAIGSESSTINGYEAVTVNFKTPNGNPTGYSVYIVNNGEFVTFTYYASDEATGKGYVEVFESIINSIKFN